MSEAFAEFKNHFLVKQALGVLQTGAPVSATWGIPNFMLTMPGVLQKFLGNDCWAVYDRMTEDEKQKALEYVSNSGTEVAELLEIPLWEDWDDSRPVRPKFDKLFAAYPLTQEPIIVAIADLVHRQEQQQA